MFHLELRQFPNVARAFNLSDEELARRFCSARGSTGGWSSSTSIGSSPDRARLTVYEGRALATDEIGMGRGWGNVTRTGTDVTERVLEAARDPSLGAAQA